MPKTRTAVVRTCSRFGAHGRVMLSCLLIMLSSFSSSQGRASGEGITTRNTTEPTQSGTTTAKSDYRAYCCCCNPAFTRGSTAGPGKPFRNTRAHSAQNTGTTKRNLQGAPHFPLLPLAPSPSPSPILQLERYRVWPCRTTHSRIMIAPYVLLSQTDACVLSAEYVAL